MRCCCRPPLGRTLLRDAVLRTPQVAGIAGIRTLVVHAKDEAARTFYERRGSLPARLDPLTLVLPLDAAAVDLDQGAHQTKY